MRIFTNPTDEPYFVFLMEVFLEVLVDRAGIVEVGNEIGPRHDRETVFRIRRVIPISDLQKAHLAAIGFFIKEFVLSQLPEGTKMTDHEVWERALIMIGEAIRSTR